MLCSPRCRSPVGQVMFKYSSNNTLLAWTGAVLHGTGQRCWRQVEGLIQSFAESGPLISTQAEFPAEIFLLYQLCSLSSPCIITINALADNGLECCLFNTLTNLTRFPLLISAISPIAKIENLPSTPSRALGNWAEVAFPEN